MRAVVLSCVVALALHVTAAVPAANGKDLTSECNLRCRLKKKLNKMEVTQQTITVFDVITATTSRPTQPTTANPTSESENNPNSVFANETTDREQEDALAEMNQIIQHPTFNKDLFQIQVSSIYQWEELLAPTPVGIAVLGDLLLFAATLPDSPLNLTESADGSKLVKYPQSFHASLVQVVNKGYDAFLKAHVNMDRIRLFAAGFPGFIKSITDVLFSNNTQRIQRALPILMDRVREDTNRSVQLALEVVTSFSEAFNLTSQINTACIMANSESETTLKNAMNEKSSLEAQLRSIDQLLEENKKSQERIGHLLDSSVKELVTAVNKLPSGASVFFQNLASILANFVMLNFARNSENSKKTPSNSTARTSNNECLEKHRFNLYTLSFIAESLRNKTKDNYKLLSSAKEGMYNASKDVTILTDVIRNTTDCKEVKQSAEQVLNFAKLLGELARNFSEVKNHPHLRSNITIAISRIRNLIGAAEVRNSEIVSNGTNIDEIETNPWLAGTTNRKIAEYRIKVAQTQLKQYLDSSRKNTQLIAENNKKYIEVLEKLQKATSETIDFNQAIQLLRRSMELLATLQQHWAKLVQFFQNFENIINVVFRTRIRDYLQYLDKIETNRNHTSADTNLLQIIYQNMVSVNEMSFTIEHLGNLYCSVSDKFLMKDIIGLYNIMMLNPETDAGKIKETRNELTRNCHTTSQEISHFVSLERGKLENVIQLKLNEIERAYHPIFENAALDNEDQQAEAMSHTNTYEIIEDDNFIFSV